MSDIVNNLFDYIASKNLEKEKNVGLVKKGYVDLSNKSKEIDKKPPSELFIELRNFTGEYLQQIMKTKERCFWFKSEMTRPFFDHFNFIYKNQIFSVLIDMRDMNDNSLMPKEFIARQLGESNKHNLVPCLFPVKIDDLVNNKYSTLNDGWNLQCTKTNKIIIPEDIISDKKILMSQWELHNYAIMQMRYLLKQCDVQIISFQDIMGVDPQLWYLDENGNKCWMVIRYFFDEKQKKLPDDITEITRRCFKFNGYFAPFIFSSKTSGKKIYRGDQIETKYLGLEKIHTFI